MKVTVIPNNGESLNKKNKTIYNQCMWISIADYLRNTSVLRITSVAELREIAGMTHHTQNSLWDEDKPWAIKAITKLCNYFDLQIHIFYLTEIQDELFVHEDWIVNNKPIPRKIIGDGQNIVNIGNYDEHFELILSFG